MVLAGHSQDPGMVLQEMPNPEECLALVALVEQDAEEQECMALVPLNGLLDSWQPGLLLELWAPS